MHAKDAPRLLVHSNGTEPSSRISAVLCKHLFCKQLNLSAEGAYASATSPDNCLTQADTCVLMLTA